MIEITSDAIERVGTLLADVPKGAERVFASAMNRGISRVKTQAIKQVKTVYAVNGAALTKATRINITKASTETLQALFHFLEQKYRCTNSKSHRRNPEPESRCGQQSKKAAAGHHLKTLSLQK